MEVVIKCQDKEISKIFFFQNSTMDKAETGVVRLRTAADTPITESQETKLRPLLEALEQALDLRDQDERKQAAWSVHTW